MFKVKLLKEYRDGDATAFIFEIDGWIQFTIMAWIFNGAVKMSHTQPKDSNNGNVLSVKNWGIANDIDRAHKRVFAIMHQRYARLLNTAAKQLQLF
jgi:hypothetical protein